MINPLAESFMSYGKADLVRCRRPTPLLWCHRDLGSSVVAEET